MSKSPKNDDEMDELQRRLNESKKRDLEEEFGGKFFETDVDLPPDVEAAWLRSFEAFEQQWESGNRITIREKLQHPKLIPFVKLPADQVPIELDKLLALLFKHQIVLDVLAEVSEEKLYRFIVEEFMDEELDDIDIPEMFTHFTYEDYYPNDRYDVDMWARDFLSDLYSPDKDYLDVHFPQDGLLDSQGKRVKTVDYLQRIKRAKEKLPAMTSVTVNELEMEIEGDEARVETDISYAVFQMEEMDFVPQQGKAKLRMRRSIYGGWDVVQAQVSGWEGVL